MQKEKPILGWREYVGFPEFKVSGIKAKVDSGARTSALHAEDIKIIKKGRKKLVSCTIYPQQDSKEKRVHAHFELVEERWVKSSVGHKTLRPVIETDLKIGNYVFPIELTLVNRDIMGFRMLLGRQAIRKKFLLDAGKSFLIGEKPQKKRPKKAAKKTKKR